MLGSNGLIFDQENAEHWGKLVERMLVQALVEDDLPRLLFKNVAEHWRGRFRIVGGFFEEIRKKMIPCPQS